MNEWDVGEVTDMHELFKGLNDFDEDISSWDVRKVSHFDSIFEGAANFNKSKIRNWRPFDLAKRRTKYNNEILRTVLAEYEEDRELTLVIYGELNNWNVSEVTNMSGLFKDMRTQN